MQWISLRLRSDQFHVNLWGVGKVKLPHITKENLLQQLSLLIGQIATVLGTATDSANLPVNTAVGNAVLAQDTNTSVAFRSNGSGDGLTNMITATGTGTTVFTLSGHQSDGVTPFSSQFEITVTKPPVQEPSGYLFEFVVGTATTS